MPSFKVEDGWTEREVAIGEEILRRSRLYPGDFETSCLRAALALGYSKEEEIPSGVRDFISSQVSQ